jgi:16S rRNA (guanine1516-N2)-methyltransferase
MITDIKIAVAAASTDFDASADRLAEELGIPRCESADSEYDYVLMYSNTHGSPRLELHSTLEDAPGPVYVEWVRGTLGFRTRRGNRGNEPLARAIGAKHSAAPTVWDATAGLGRDAFILAALGCRVRLMERSPIIAALLRDGLARALDHDGTRTIAHRMRLCVGDAISVLEHCPENERPDVVYLDPMYPHRTKSALVKKEMRVLRALVGEDLDAPQMLKIALGVARKRVVVKRPRLAEPLPGIAPSHSLVGSTTRFDVYICAAESNTG